MHKAGTGFIHTSSVIKEYFLKKKCINKTNVDISMKDNFFSKLLTERRENEREETAET